MFDSTKQLKFADDSTTTVIVKGRQQDDFNKDVVLIEPLPDGFDHFKPSDGLLKKMKESNTDAGDTIQIKKVNDPKYPFPYFNVEVLQKAPLTKQSVINEDKGIKNFEKQFKEPEKNLSIHELSLRVEELEKKVTSLLGDAGHKPGDDDLPF